MPKYKITKGSVKPLGNGVEMLVTFIRDDGTESHEQRYEVNSTDEQKIYDALDKASLGFEAMGVEAPEVELDEDVELEQGAKVSALKEVTPE